MMQIMYQHKVSNFRNLHLLDTADRLVICLLQREYFLSNLLLVGSEPILTWVLSGSNSGFHSGLSFLNLISVNTITLNLSLTSQHFLPMSNAYGVSSGQSNISIPSIYKKSWLLMPTS